MSSSTPQRPSDSQPPPSSTSRRQNTDVRRRTVLPKTLQNMKQSSILNDDQDMGLVGTSTTLNANEYLDQIEEELNRKVDHDVEVLVNGMAELVKISKIQGKDHFKVSQEAFAAECRTESMIKATESLLSLSHTLKLLHLFSDTSTPALTRERRHEELERIIREEKSRVEQL